MYRYIESRKAEDLFQATEVRVLQGLLGTDAVGGLIDQHLSQEIEKDYKKTKTKKNEMSR